MKNENLMNSSFSRIMDPGFFSDEFNSHESGKKYDKIREYMNKFIQNLNRCKNCNTIPDQVHTLYLALRNLENVEKELITSNFAEELLYQEKIIEDIHSLKLYS